MCTFRKFLNLKHLRLQIRKEEERKQREAEALANALAQEGHKEELGA